MSEKKKKVQAQTTKDAITQMDFVFHEIYKTKLQQNKDINTFTVLLAQEICEGNVIGRMEMLRFFFIKDRSP